MKVVKSIKMIDYLKTLIVSVFTGVTVFLHPIAGDVYSLVIIFALNFLFGLLNGLIVKGESFQFKKAWRCILEAAMFFVLVASIFSIGKLKDAESGAIQCVSYVVYSVIYFYAVNVLKNAKGLFKPSSAARKVLNWIYYVISVEFVKKIPGLVDYFDSKRKDAK